MLVTTALTRWEGRAMRQPCATGAREVAVVVVSAIWEDETTRWEDTSVRGQSAVAGDGG